MPDESKSGALLPPEESALVLPAEDALADARALVIDSPHMCEVAAAELRKIKAKTKAREDERFELTRPLDKSKAGIMELYRKPLELLAQAERVLKGAIGAYQQRIEDERREAQRRADEAARQERQRLEAEAAAERAEAMRKADELRKQAETARAAGEAAKAARLETRADGALEKAEDKAETLQAAAAAVPSVVVTSAPRTTGISTPVTFACDPDVDVVALAAFVAQTPAFRNLLAANMPALNAQARAMKGAFNIPGCRLLRKTGVSVR